MCQSECNYKYYSRQDETTQCFQVTIFQERALNKFLFIETIFNFTAQSLCARGEYVKGHSLMSTKCNGFVLALA